MRRNALWAVILFTFAAGTAGADTRADHPVLRAIGNEEARGEITGAQADLYTVLYLTGSSDLPVRFSDLDGETLRCGTQILSEIAERAAGYSGEARQGVDKALARPAGLSESIDTEHFRIHYATSGGNVIWGWPDPTYRDGVAEACEASWQEYHSSQSWDVVPGDGAAGGGSDLTDCYVTNLGPGLYGYAEWESAVDGGAPNDRTGFFVIDNDYTGFGYADRLDPAKVTIAHEFHHVIQFGYTYGGGGGWWMEQTSTMQEDEVYDDINDNYDYLGCFLALPYKKLSYTNGCHEYGGFIWPRFMRELFDLQLIEDIWHDLKWSGGNGLSQAEANLAGRGSSLDGAFIEFGTWNFYTSVRDDGGHYEEGAGYNAVAYDRIFTSYPWHDQHPSANRMPDRLGTSYMRFQPDPVSTHNILRLTFDGPPGTASVKLLAKEEGAGTFHEHVMTLDGNQDGVIEVQNWDLMDYAYMAVAMGNLSADAQDYVFDAVTEQGSASVGDGPQRIVLAAQSSPNPFHPVTTIRYSLGEGAEVLVRVVDASGRSVRTLVDGPQAAGRHEVLWSAEDDAGRRVPAGVYFYQIQAGGYARSQKMVLLP